MTTRSDFFYNGEKLCDGVRVIGYPEADSDIAAMDTLRYYASCAELAYVA